MEKTFIERINALNEKCSKIGASFGHDFYDENHLDCFWYDGNDIASIEYKGYLISFDVCGDISIGVCENGTDPLNFRHKGGGEPFFENSDVRHHIKDDNNLKSIVYKNNIIFDNNNWINIVVSDLATAAYVSEPEVAGENNILDAVEANFDYYIDYIDRLIKER